MDKIVLGLLMLHRLTVYELRSIVAKNFKGMCSDSLGGIQAAVKKLLAAGMITCIEYVENSVNKKRYSITDKGRKEFSEWLKNPADLSNTKNIELGKLLFMGLTPLNERPRLVDGMIKKLEEAHSFLHGVKAAINYAGVDKAVAYWNSDLEYCEGIKNAVQNGDMIENANGIGYFQMVTLQYGIDCIKFNIDWLYALKNKIEGEIENEKI